jgi:hypothetical protein
MGRHFESNLTDILKEEDMKNILIIGDGMQLEHEIAASRYLYGKDSALEFHKFPYKGFMSTWDVTTYNRYAAAYGADPYDPDAIDPYVGYDPAEGGARPYPSQKKHINDDYFLTKLGGKYPATDSASAAPPGAPASRPATGTSPGSPAIRLTALSRPSPSCCAPRKAAPSVR